MSAIAQAIAPELLQRAQGEVDQVPGEEAVPQLMSSLAAHIRKVWDVNKEHKREVEATLLECLRLRNGEYSPQELMQIREIGGSEVFATLTATRVRSAAAWISDILLPAGDKAWALEPTPVPDLPPAIKEAAAAFLTQEVGEAQTMGVEPTPQQIEDRTIAFKRKLLQALQEQAEKAARSMEERIADQFAESGWEQAMENFIDDFCTFPAAFLKGPVYRRKRALEWGPNGEPVVVDKVIEADARVSPFDVFPSPGAVDIEDGDFIERVRYTEDELYGLIGVPGYAEEAIRAVLEEHTDFTSHDWESGADGERRQLEGWDLRDEDGLIPALHFWGNASGWDLREWGLGEDVIPDPAAQYQIEAILIGRHVIRAQLNPDVLGRRPYYKASFQGRPGNFWGLSVPQLMAHIQRSANAILRALINNMSLASGPMMWINIDQLPQGESVTGLHPWKIFQGVSNPAQSGVPIQFFQPQSNAGDLVNVYQMLEAQADDATNVPKYMYGSNERMAGAAATAQGLAMLQESATKAIKAAVRRIDLNVIRPRVERQYHYNMLYLDDPSIKGDLNVVARGSSALVAKAAVQTRRNEFLALISNPIDQGIVDIERRAKLLRAIADDLDLPGIVPDEEEVALAQQQAAQSPPPPDPRVEVEQLRLEWERMKLEQLLADKERDRDAQMIKAEYALKGDMMQLAGKGELTLEQIKAKLAETALRERSANERFVAERKIKHQFGSGI